METRNIFTLTAIFAVLLLSLSLVAAVNLNEIDSATATIPTSVESNAGSFAITFDLTNTGVAGTLDWNASALTSGTGTFSFSQDTIADGSTTAVTDTITATVTFPAGQTGNIAGTIDVIGQGAITHKTLAFSVPITAANEPEDITECDIAGNLGELSLTIEDINVLSGFGDDDEFWYLFDEIEVEIEVENKGDWDIENIEVKWGIYNTDEGDFIIDDEENDFNLDEDDDEEVILLIFTLDEKIKKYSGGDNILYVWAVGQIDDNDAGVNDGDDTCEYDSYEADIVTDDKFVIVTDIEMQETASCGADVPLTFSVENIGDDEEEEVLVIISNSELGINERIEMGDIEDFENEEVSILLNIPEDAKEKLQYIEFTVYDEDSDIYETDEDEDKSKILVPIKIEGSCSDTVITEPTITANLLSDAVIGEELVIQVTVTNNLDSSENFVVAVEGADGWAEIVDVDPAILTISQGSTKTATVTLNPTEAGTQTFDITLIYSGQEKTQPVSVSIEDKAGFLTGAFVGVGNTGLYVIAAVFLVLIILILILIIKVAKSPKAAEF